MKTLKESILSSTGAGAFRFTSDMLVRLCHSMPGIDRQFNIRKMMDDFNIHDTKDYKEIIWQALCHINTKKTKKETKEALIHHFVLNGPEDKFFKDVFKDYLLNPDDFDFFCYAEDNKMHIGTHEKKHKGGKIRQLFVLDLNKIK